MQTCKSTLHDILHHRDASYAGMQEQTAYDEEIEETVFDAIPQQWCFHKMGDRVGICRFFGVYQAMKQYHWLSCAYFFTLAAGLFRSFPTPAFIILFWLVLMCL